MCNLRPRERYVQDSDTVMKTQQGKLLALESTHDGAAADLRRCDDRQLHLERGQRRGGQDESDDEGGDEPHVRVGF